MTSGFSGAGVSIYRLSGASNPRIVLMSRSDGSKVRRYWLTCPMFFSGMVFSTLLRSCGEISGVMSANLFGAMCGRLLEYNSMYFGIRSLYLMAVGLYLLAFFWGTQSTEQVLKVSTQSAP